MNLYSRMHQMKKVIGLLHFEYMYLCNICIFPPVRGMFMLIFKTNEWVLN